MTEIVRPDGHLLTTVKRSHEPERVQKQRMDISKELADCVNGFLQDMQPDPIGASKPNRQAIYEHWLSRWKQRVAIVQKSSEPVDIDPEAFDRHLREYDERAAVAALSQRPLAELDPDQLRQFGLHFLANTELGAIHISNRFAVVLDASGAGYLHLPDVADGDDWTHCIVQDMVAMLIPFQVKRNGLNHATIQQVMAALGIKAWALPSAKQIMLAAQTYETKRPWFLQRRS